MPKKNRKYRIIHEPYLTEWLSQEYPPGSWKTNVRLGKIRKKAKERAHNPEEERALMPFLASCDAIIFLEDRVDIIEAMVRQQPGKIEQLVKYERLFKMTEDFREFWKYPTRKVLLTPLEQEFLEEFRKEFGVEIETYRPPWVMEYIRSLPRRQTRGKLSEVEPPEE